MLNFYLKSNLSNLMDKLPKELVPCSDLSCIYSQHYLSYIRKYIFEKMLSPNFNIPDNCGINLQDINMGYLETNQYSINKKCLNIIREELHSLGWETETAYGDTTLFVYIKDKKPKQLVGCKVFDA